ncbi:MAG: hypothetical protein Q8O99_02300 [bacterium]|nr:hypothetical protein [bacterium]
MTRSSLMMSVRRMIAIPRFPQKIANKTTSMLNIGRFTISIRSKDKGFIAQGEKTKKLL